MPREVSRSFIVVRASKLKLAILGKVSEDGIPSHESEACIPVSTREDRHNHRSIYLVTGEIAAPS